MRLWLFRQTNSPERLSETTNPGRWISGAIAFRWVDSSLSHRPSNGKPIEVSPSWNGRGEKKGVRGRGRVCAKRAPSLPNSRANNRHCSGKRCLTIVKMFPLAFEYRPRDERIHFPLWSSKSIRIRTYYEYKWAHSR